MCEPEPQAVSHDREPTFASHFFFYVFSALRCLDIMTNVFLPAVDRALAHLLLKTYLASTIKTN